LYYIQGSSGWFDTKKWVGNGGLPPITLLACIPPIIVLILKFITIVPPFSGRIDRVSKGLAFKKVQK
jgi:hypothetical protein